MSNLDFTGLWLDVTAKYLERNSTRLIVASIFTLLVVVPIYRSRRQGLGTSRLQGPRSESFIFGNTKKIFPSANLSLVYRDWERLYGPVYEIPTGIGSSHIVLSDPKAFSHIFSKDTTTYHVLAGTSALSKKLASILFYSTFLSRQPHSVPVW
ncbi:hypothetical protein APHAL10511_003493 [Amanita phalloides]|nr:hypothetical protein APHAL10511_003493 [Amanita phalloides]